MKSRKLTTDKVSVSIVKEVNKELSDYCEEKLINKSKLINKLIEDFLEKNKILYESSEKRK